MPDAVVFVIVIVSVLLLATAIRYLASKYAGTKVALVMLAVEKKLATWAVEQATSGEKHKEAIAIIADRVYPMLPFWVRMFITKEQAIAQIDRLYSEMLDFLDDGKINESIKLN